MVMVRVSMKNDNNGRSWCTHKLNKRPKFVSASAPCTHAWTPEKNRLILYWTSKEWYFILISSFVFHELSELWSFANITSKCTKIYVLFLKAHWFSSEFNLSSQRWADSAWVSSRQVSLNQNRLWHITMEIQVLAWDRYKYVAGLNWLMGS